jgi:hypothetical protein
MKLYVHDFGFSSLYLHVSYICVNSCFMHLLKHPVKALETITTYAYQHRVET